MGTALVAVSLGLRRFETEICHPSLSFVLTVVVKTGIWGLIAGLVFAAFWRLLLLREAGR